ncbi:TetR/AcrR family transcriptional regulator [Peptoniphilaceae bacterium SGI.097]
MPKSTFFNLPPEKQECIRRALISEFETHPLAEASVKHIVETLGIARGSFYQYFEDLTESYFYILEQETTELHTLFAKLMQESDDAGSALDAFGPRVAEELFDPLRISLYRSRYLGWTAELEGKWNEYLEKNQDPARKKFLRSEQLLFMKAVVHDLILRSFTENWSKKEFLEHYRRHVIWLKGGIV